jgi:hypothetical protein
MGRPETGRAARFDSSSYGKDSLKSSLFSGFSVGEEHSFRVPHLQFADDTILFAEKKFVNIRAIKLRDDITVQPAPAQLLIRIIGGGAGAG